MIELATTTITMDIDQVEASTETKRKSVKDSIKVSVHQEEIVNMTTAVWSVENLAMELTFVGANNRERVVRIM